MKKNLFYIGILAGTVSFSCAEKTNTPVLDASTPITLNGTTYTSKGSSYFDYGSGSIDFTDSAISNDGTRYALINMSFSLTSSKPLSGDYTIFTDSFSLVGPGAVEFNLYENTLSGKILYAHKIQTPTNGVVKVTNLDNKVSYKFNAQNLVGLPFDTVTGVSSGPSFNSTLSAATITEE